MKKKGFTLIELIAVLVILAILALIVTPLVMNIIRKAKPAADKRSIDAYGRSIEIAIAGYLLDTGTFPTSIGELTVEYSGDRVVCSTTQLNSDSSIYLAECTVGGRSVDYTYGTDTSSTYTAYSIGDEVTYNNVNYYVIKDSSASEKAVTMLKAEPLTVAEVNQYGGVGTANNHVNMYVTDDASSSYFQKANDSNGYGGMAYYSKPDCGASGSSGCITNYAQSDIKHVIDMWKTAQAPAASEARLISIDEYKEYCVDEEYQLTPSDTITICVSQYDWMYNSNYWYWTMTPYDDSQSYVFIVSNNGSVGNFGVYYFYGSGVVRPVITISKSALSA